MFDYSCFSWQPQTKFPFKRVRLPPTVKDDEKEKKDFAEGQEVEVCYFNGTIFIYF